MNRIISLAVYALAGATLPCAAIAQTAAITPGALTAGVNTTSYEMGFSFTPQTAINVTALGAFDLGQDGLSQSHIVSIWDANRNLLTTATVTNANALNGSFRYAPISYMLNAGTTYTIGASNYSAAAGQDDYAYDTSRTIASGITYNGARYAATNASSYPTTSDNTYAFYGANFLFVAAAAPEPATWALMILGFGMAGYALRRRRSIPGVPALT